MVATKVSRSHSIALTTKISFVVLAKRSIITHAKPPASWKSVESYNSSKLNSVLAEMKSLKVKYERLKHDISGNRKEINQLKESCKKEIKQFRKEIETILDDLEKNILMELDKCKQDEERCVDQGVSTIAAALNVFQVDCKSLEDAKRDGKKEAMFISVVKVSKALINYRRTLGELEKDFKTPTLAFERNETLDNLAACINSLGSLRARDK